MCVLGCGSSGCASGASIETGSTCCPVDGVWGAWGPWAAWAGVCNAAPQRARTRACAAPSCGGAACVGPATATVARAANLNCCPGFYGFAAAGRCNPCTVCPPDTEITSCSPDSNTVCKAAYAPTIALRGPDPMVVQAGTAWVDPGANASTAPGIDLTPNITVTPTAPDMRRVGLQILTYAVVNALGSAAYATRAVNVTDTMPPAIALRGAARVTVEAGSVYEDLGANASDLADGELLPAVVGLPIDTRTIGTYIVNYTACDTQAAPPHCVWAARTVLVEQTIRPIIVLRGNISMTTEMLLPFADPGYNVTDTLFNNLSSAVHTDYSMLVGKVFEPVANVTTGQLHRLFRLTYTVSNPHGLAAIPATRNVTVVETTPPVVTILGPASISTQGGVAYRDQGASAVDQVDGNLTGSVYARVVLTVPPDAIYSPLTPPAMPTTGNLSIVNTFAPLNSTFVITYYARDSSGNVGSTTRNVTIADSLAPTVVTHGDRTLIVRVNSTYDDPGASAIDRYFGDISSNIIVSTHADQQPQQALTNLTRKAGNYSVYYAVSDHIGQSTRIQGRNVRVLDGAGTDSSGGMQLGISISTGLSTPPVPAAVAYQAVVVLVLGSNLGAILLAAGIVPLHHVCDLTPQFFQRCTFESVFLSVDQLNALRPKVWAASRVPTAIQSYAGAFTTVAGSAPTAGEAGFLLQQQGFVVTSVSCTQSVCMFTASNRPALVYADPGSRRRRMVSVDSTIIGLVLAPVVVQTLQSQFQTVGVQSLDDMWQPLGALGVLPSSAQCAGDGCTVQTSDPISAVDASIFNSSALVPGTFQHFTGVRGAFSWSGSVPEAAFLLISNGIAPIDLSCDTSAPASCAFTSPSAAIRDIRVDGSSLVTFSIVTSSPASLLASGAYKGTILATSTTNATACLTAAAITTSWLACAPSLTIDNAILCDYYTAAVSPPVRLAALRAQPGVLSASEHVAVTQSSEMAAALPAVLASLTGAPISRFANPIVTNLTSASLVDISIQVLPVPMASSRALDRSLWAVLFRIRGYWSISITSAQAMAAICGLIDAIAVEVDGALVRVVVLSYIPGQLTCLRNHPWVLDDSVAVATCSAVLTAAEIAGLVQAAATSNLLTVPLAGRAYWSEGSVRTIPANSTTATTATTVSPSVSLALVLGVAVGGAVAIASSIILILTKRCHRHRRDSKVPFVPSSQTTISASSRPPLVDIPLRETIIAFPAPEGAASGRVWPPHYYLESSLMWSSDSDAERQAYFAGYEIPISGFAGYEIPIATVDDGDNVYETAPAEPASRASHRALSGQCGLNTTEYYGFTADQSNPYDIAVPEAAHYADRASQAVCLAGTRMYSWLPSPRIAELQTAIDACSPAAQDCE
eukprot:m.9016 g.9016  ORF g.9016 m.9016 type:complete len:1373 (+) comp2356_c0_seq1:816-4934(+)